MEWPKECLATINDVTTDIATLGCTAYLIKNIIDAALAFSGTVAVIMIIWGGFKFVTSGGDPKQAGAARQIITFAIIGLLIVLFSFFIIDLVAYFTGADCIKYLGFQACPR